MNEILNHGINERDVVLREAEEKSTLRDHLKCGEVYTWLCDGELYAIECNLCDDRPLCPLSEFPQHMEIWHTDWQDQSLRQTHDQHDIYNTEDEDQEDEEDEEHYHDFFTTEDSGLFEAGDQLPHIRVRQEDDSALEPFEQVLIQQDNTIDSTQLKEDGEVAENKLKNENKQVAKEEKAVKGVNSYDQLKLNVNNNLTLGKHKQTNKTVKITDKERDQEDFQTITESENENKEVNENERVLQTTTTTEISNCKNENETKFKEFLKNPTIFNRIKRTGKKFTKTNEMRSKYFKKSNKITKTIKYNLRKIKEIKRNLLEILRNSTNLQELTETESETSENEIQEEEFMKSLQNEQNFNQAKSLKINKNKEVKRNFQKILRNSQKLQQITKSETSGNETCDNETSKNETMKTKLNTTKEKLTKSKNISKYIKENLNKTKENHEIETFEIETENSKMETLESEKETRETSETEEKICEFEEETSEIEKEPSEIEKEMSEKETDCVNFQEMRENLTNEFEKETIENEKEYEHETNEIKPNCIEIGIKTNGNETQKLKNIPMRKTHIHLKRINKYSKILRKSKRFNGEKETEEGTSENETNCIKNNNQLLDENNKNISQNPLKLRTSKRFNKTKDEQNESSEIEEETSEIEIKDIQNKDILRKLNNRIEINKIILEKSQQIRKSKRLLKNNKTETDENKITTETSESETNSLNNSETIRKCDNSKQNTRKLRKSLRISKGSSENGIEVNGNETQLKGNGKEFNKNKSLDVNAKELMKNEIVIEITTEIMEERHNETELNESERETTTENEIMQTRNEQELNESTTEGNETREIKEFPKEFQYFKAKNSISSNNLGTRRRSTRITMENLRHKLQDPKNNGEGTTPRTRKSKRNLLKTETDSENQYSLPKKSNKSHLKWSLERASEQSSTESSEIIEENSLQDRSTVTNREGRENFSEIETLEFDDDYHSFAKRTKKESSPEVILEQNSEANLKINKSLEIEDQEKTIMPFSPSNLASKKEIKQTLVTQYFINRNDAIKTLPDKQQNETENNTQDSYSLNSYDLSNPTSPSQNITPGATNVAPLSPLSPKTEEEHFEFYEPKEKLNKQHISYLIQLFQQQPRLWDQSHPEFFEPQICRKSWQQITDQWNEFCKRNFRIAEVRIRISTLCQRYLQERERLALEGELDEFAKFPYYEQMQFLEQQKSLQKRRELYEQQNEKILEIYQNFPILWHVGCYKTKQAKEKAQAFESISKLLKSSSIHLSSIGVQKRIRSLRKCYRLEKIRHLHAQVEQTPFESEFRHYERMQFLDKHIDPFVCRICSKIFENLVGFREHLEVKNHGNILQEESESEEEEDIKNGDALCNESTVYDIDNNDIQSSCNSPLNSSMDIENPEDILQTFTPLTSTPIAELNDFTADFQETQEISENQDVLIFPPSVSTVDSSTANSYIEEDQLIEEIMETVTSNDSFTNQTLDQFINTATNCEIPATQRMTNFTSALKTISLGKQENMDPIHNDRKDPEPITIPAMEQTKCEQNSLDNSQSSNPLIVKVQCDNFSLDLQLNPEHVETSNINTNDSDHDHEFYSSADISTIPLPDYQIHKMIELYRKYPQLWNPNHLDYNSRNLRRQAWCSLTAEFNKYADKQFSWRTMHRKLTDYAKYYKKLITEQEDYEELENKWTFYEDFKFMDDVIVVHGELQRTVHHRDNNFKIIAIYETFPQLWDIKHTDYNKRCIKQRNFELMCNRLQEENNLQITTERLKNRLIELRAQYRLAKKQRLKCEKNGQTFSTDFEFYEVLNFLDDHIDPFVCECKIEFKKLTDYNQHQKREHERKTLTRNRTLSTISLETDRNLDNICHICGIKFTTRSNLVHHIKRHEGIRNYECPMCKKKFYTSHQLKVHIRSHTKECPYTCEKCGNSFVSASKLNQHVKRHLDRKDFQCNYCPKAFYSAHEKDRHEKRHLNIREKVCPVCGKTFVAGSSYYAHMMLHSDTKRFECDKCEMKFAQYAGLYKHKKKYHS